jgi:Domain of unknown function (DUF5916)
VNVVRILVKRFWPLCTAVALLSHCHPAIAAEDPAAAAPMRATRLSKPPVVDGILDDEAWTGAPLPAGTWLSYNPLHGDKIAQQTTVWVGYDADALYFAFRCDDPDPGGIKTSITRRDNIWSDDWVGLSLDALGTGQVSYHLMVNPSGIQLDMINTIAGNEDTSPDWIWESAGRVNERGYAVEIRLPLQTIRFKGGADVNMGILFWRRVSRIGVSVAWPALEPGKWVFEKHAKLAFSDLQARPTREVIPSATYSRTQDRETPTNWGVDNTGDLGLSAKWGLTSTITLDATVNPDFSQVESDAFQVEVNQRFPVYFSEKRPFFMEGAGMFNLAGNGQGDASMLYAVNTRNIVDPIFGAKLTGSVGRVTFGTLTAVDQDPGNTDDPEDPLTGKDKFFQIARAQMSLKPGSYAGALATFTNLAGRTNAVAGGDVSLKFKGSHQVTGFALASTTDDPEETDRSSGLAAQANYSFNSRRVNLSAQFEHYDRLFAMDTAFLNRTGVTGSWVYVDYNFYPDKDKHSWIRRIVPFTFFQGGRDRVQGGDEYVSVTGARLSFTRQGFFRADMLFSQEPWQGREFEGKRVRMFGNVQLFRWLRPYSNINWGDAIYYDEIDPFLGKSVNISAGALFQPNGRFSEDVEYTHIAFDRPSTGERVYTVNIVNTRTTFQFSKEFALRAIVQYDSQQTRVLTDFLGSYELRPGTVVYAGYGSLYEKRDYQNDAWLEGQGNYLTTRRGLFLKASYLYRF